METVFAGFALGLTLILAIGAQNAFVLRQGLRQQYVFVICLTCALSDAILIAAGVAGFGWMVETAPWIKPVFTWGGAVFLIFYGFMNACAAWRGGEALEAAENSRKSLAKTLGICLALTWLNPHVYLDTLVLLGSVSTDYPDKLAFGAGAVFASFTFFFSLGYGARFLAPMFARPIAWRILDGLVAFTMWGIAAKLLFAGE